MKQKNQMFKSKEQNTAAGLCKSVFSVHANCSTTEKGEGKQNHKPLQLWIKKGEIKAVISIFQIWYMYGLLLYGIFLSLLFFIRETSKCYFGAQQIPALGEQDSQAVTKLCHPLQGVIFILFYIQYMYIFLLDLAVLDWPWFNWDYSSTWVRDSHFGYVHIHSRSMASN